MLPHGGPELRDYWEFDAMVQLLASRGYQVFQPNFRGSSGFGKRFSDAGKRQWGAAMQNDLTDALMHLAKNGYASLDRACIVGASYGGYAALAAAEDGVHRRVPVRMSGFRLIAAHSSASTRSSSSRETLTRICRSVGRAVGITSRVQENGALSGPP